MRPLVFAFSIAFAAPLPQAHAQSPEARDGLLFMVGAGFGALTQRNEGALDQLDAAHFDRPYFAYGLHTDLQLRFHDRLRAGLGVRYVRTGRKTTRDTAGARPTETRSFRVHGIVPELSLTPLLARAGVVTFGLRAAGGYGTARWRMGNAVTQNGMYTASAALDIEVDFRDSQAGLGVRVGYRLERTRGLGALELPIDLSTAFIDIHLTWGNTL
ncbi:MAG: hypothetical protein AAF938_21735 [Myxococcota bacterium]